MTNTDRKPRRDVYQEVTDAIIHELESGVQPWRKPWSSAHTEGACCCRCATTASPIAAKCHHVLDERHGQTLRH